jgi:excisionase family DNA binding protein
MEDDSLWGYEEVAKYLKVAESTVQRWAGQGTIPTLKIGGQNRFDPSAIREWAKTRKEVK